MSDKEFLFPYLVNHQTLNTVKKKSEDYQGDKILIQDTSDFTIFLFFQIRKEFSKANLKASAYSKNEIL